MTRRWEVRLRPSPQQHHHLLRRTLPALMWQLIELIDSADHASARAVVVAQQLNDSADQVSVQAVLAPCWAMLTVAWQWTPPESWSVIADLRQRESP
mmetsp:Transcript_28192/g.51566  ORF Transcript_28192/g.51566 Transcript_28192/m.51566 type:complete len:97 (-) Transcript_28192:292-582(-)